MYPSQLEFIRHIEEECAFILEVTDGKTKEEIFKDIVLSKALVRSFEIIGEATKKLDSQFKNNYPQIEWKVMAGMRDRLIHQYFGVDYDVVYNTITGDVPELYHEIQRIIRLESNQ